MHIIGIFHRTLQCRRAAGSGKGRMGSDHSLSIWEAKFVNNKLVCFSASGPWWICLTCLRVTGPKAPPHFPPRLPPSGAGDPISTQIGTSPGLPAGRTPGGCCKALICTLAVASSISQARIKTALYLPGWSALPPRPREKRNHTHAPSRNSSSNFSACHRWERYSCCCRHRQKRNTHTHTHTHTTHNNPPISLHIKSQEIFLQCVFLPLTQGGPCDIILKAERWQFISSLRHQGLPRWRSGKESACQCRRCKRHRFHPWVGKIPWRRKWPPTSVFLPGKSHGQRSLAGYSPGGHKESDMTEHTHRHTRHQNNGKTWFLKIMATLVFGLKKKHYILLVVFKSGFLLLFIDTLIHF